MVKVKVLKRWLISKMDKTNSKRDLAIEGTVLLVDNDYAKELEEKGIVKIVKEIETSTIINKKKTMR